MKTVHYTPYATLLEKSDSPILFEVKRSLRSVLGYISMSLISLAVSLIIISAWGHVRLNSGIPVLDWVSVHWLLLVPLGIAIEVVRQYHDDLYIFQRHKVTHKGGRLSLKYNIPVVKYSHVRAISVRQSIFGRIFDYGNVDVGTAAQLQSEMVIEGVRSPYLLARWFEDARDEERRRILKGMFTEDEADEIEEITASFDTPEASAGASRT